MEKVFSFSFGNMRKKYVARCGVLRWFPAALASLSKIPEQIWTCARNRHQPQHQYTKWFHPSEKLRKPNFASAFYVFHGNWLFTLWGLVAVVVVFITGCVHSMKMCRVMEVWWRIKWKVSPFHSSSSSQLRVDEKVFEPKLIYGIFGALKIMLHACLALLIIGIDLVMLRFLTLGR